MTLVTRKRQWFRTSPFLTSSYPGHLDFLSEWEETKKEIFKSICNFYLTSDNWKSDFRFPSLCGRNSGS